MQELRAMAIPQTQLQMCGTASVYFRMWVLEREVTGFSLQATFSSLMLVLVVDGQQSGPSSKRGRYQTLERPPQQPGKGEDAEKDRHDNGAGVSRVSLDTTILHDYIKHRD